MTDRVRKIMIETCDFMTKHVKEHPNASAPSTNQSKTPVHDKMVHARELGFWAGRRAVYEARL